MPLNNLYEDGFVLDYQVVIYLLPIHHPDGVRIYSRVEVSTDNSRDLVTMFLFEVC